MHHRTQIALKLNEACCISRRAGAKEGDIKFLEPESSIIGRFVEQNEGWQRFETLDFQLDIPPEFKAEPIPEEAPLPGAAFPSLLYLWLSLKAR